jgi:hypothetical protein
MALEGDTLSMPSWSALLSRRESELERVQVSNESPGLVGPALAQVCRHDAVTLRLVHSLVCGLAHCAAEV